MCSRYFGQRSFFDFSQYCRQAYEKITNENAIFNVEIDYFNRLFFRDFQTNTVIETLLHSYMEEKELSKKLFFIILNYL